MKKEKRKMKRVKNKKESNCFLIALIFVAILSSFFILLFSFACKTIQEEPIPEPEPEPQPVHRSVVIFNAISNPTTGYDWEIWIDQNSTGRFALNNIKREEIYPGAMGSPQKQEYTLRSSRPGRVVVHFIYRRPLESFGGGGQEIGRRVYSFDIAQDLTIKHIDTQTTLKPGQKEDSLPVIEEPDIRN